MSVQELAESLAARSAGANEDVQVRWGRGYLLLLLSVGDGGPVSEWAGRVV